MNFFEPLRLSDSRSYGEVEFLFAGIKILMLVALILFGLVADLGGVNGVYTGGKYWREEPFNDSFESLSPVSLARFLGFWKVLTQAAFAFGGIEGIGVLAGEAFNPRKTMRMAVRTVFYRIGECAPRPTRRHLGLFGGDNGLVLVLVLVVCMYAWSY
jgi:amino acid transporter